MADQKFHHLMYTILVVEKKAAVKEVAAALGLKDPALYSRLYGRVKFSADEAQQLLRLLDDVRLFDLFLENTSYTAVPKNQIATGWDTESLRKQAGDVILEASDVLREVELSLADDNRVDHIDRARIRKQIYEAERALSALRSMLAGK